MAKQLFYSRVPAKIAMFYKSNGFDTFACSTGINQDFIEKDLNVILEQKLTSEELGLIRVNELKPVYFHFCTKDGVLVESCLSYLLSDYTGERSSYLSHSLVFDDEEIKDVHFNYNKIVLNENLFIHNLSKFDITSPNAKPIKDYKEIKFESVELEEPFKWLTENFDSGMLKRFIFAMIGALCGKYKSVYVILPNDSDVDKNSLLFFNSIVNLFPYHARRALSYVSRVKDFNKYNGFKLKVIDSTVGIAPVSKGVTVDFQNKMIYGIKDNDYKLCGNVPDFIYRLINKEEERMAFFKFVKEATEKLEVLKSLDFKTIIELVYLFKVSSNFYDENAILSDDEKVLEFFTYYEKYRMALSDEYRMNGIKCLRRYPTNYQMIPKLVFNKINKIYQTEINGTKHIIMNVCLDLIHTDLMRNQLFNFINAAYKNEDEETKSKIIVHLTNVFYGGFLQDQILDLYNKYFTELSSENRLLVIDKLLLSIRTPEIQNGIIDFISNKYDVLTIEEKTLIYKTTAEHLVEGDDLARKLLAFCDNYIINEEESLVNAYYDLICDVLLAEEKRNAQLLLSLVSESNGFTFETVTQYVFTKWRKRKISTEFITLACRGTIVERVKKIVKMWELVQNDIEDELSKKFIDCVLNGFDLYPCTCTIGELFDAQDILFMGFRKINKEKSNEFVQIFKKEVFSKLVEDSLVNVFRSEKKNAVERVIELSDENESIKNVPNFLLLDKYMELKNSFVFLDIPDIFKCLNDLTNYYDIYKVIGNYFNIDYFNGLDKSDIEEVLSDEFILGVLVGNYFKTKSLKFSYTYDKVCEYITNIYQDEAIAPLDLQKYKCTIFKKLLSYGLLIEEKDYPQGFIDFVRHDENGILPVATDIVINYGLKQLKVLFEDITDDKLKLVNYLLEKTKKVKSNAKLFAKVVNI